MRKSRSAHPPRNETDIEALAAKAKQNRIATCGEEVNKVLEKHKCQMAIMLKAVNLLVALSHIVALPGVVTVVSK